MVKIPLGRKRRRFALVDDVDAGLRRFGWRLSRSQGIDYAGRDYVREDGSNAFEFLHRRVLGLTDSGIIVDHVNGDGLDCRRANLRIASAAENSRNARKHRDNASGFKGVSWDRTRGRWQAQITVRGRRFRLGRFTDPRAAAAAYDAGAREHFGAFAALNFPREGERAA